MKKLLIIFSILFTNCVFGQVKPDTTANYQIATKSYAKPVKMLNETPSLLYTKPVKMLNKTSSFLYTNPKGEKVLEIVTSINGIACQDTIITDTLANIRMLLSEVNKAYKKQQILYKMDMIINSWNVSDKAKFKKLQKELKEIK